MRAVTSWWCRASTASVRPVSRLRAEPRCPRPWSRIAGDRADDRCSRRARRGGRRWYVVGWPLGVLFAVLLLIAAAAAAAVRGSRLSTDERAQLLADVSASLERGGPRMSAPEVRREPRRSADSARAPRRARPRLVVRRAAAGHASRTARKCSPTRSRCPHADAGSQPAGGLGIARSAAASPMCSTPSRPGWSVRRRAAPTAKWRERLLHA